jgi:type VI secretion system protein ImpM
MRCGLYGKLPAKRDFVAVSTPRGFLDAWEPWMQGGISASREALGDAWQEAFLRAPIWRFWLGAELCGTTVLGAFMSSLDGVGRYYPLTLLTWAEDGEAIPPPELDPQEDWFARAEEFLLATLEHDVPFESTTAALERLDPPLQDRRPTMIDDMIPLAPGGTALPVQQRPVGEVFASLRTVDHVRVYAAASFWWTIGGEGYDPIALSGSRMPHPFLFSDMLTGRFAERFG